MAKRSFEVLGRLVDDEGGAAAQVAVDRLADYRGRRLRAGWLSPRLPR